MKETVFKKARKILELTTISVEGFGNEREFWKVGECVIEVRTEKSGLKFSCTCKHCSIYSGFEPFCSYKATLISYLVMSK